MTTEIHLSDWAAITSEVQQFGGNGEVTSSDDQIRVEFGGAYIELRKEGVVRTGMPLHDLEYEGDGVLIVDHETGSITVKTDSFEYTFRRR